MIIKSITLENFRQYKELQTIKFATDKKKNVTVIIGANTCGKTTLVQAFRWCLYGKNVKDSFVDKSLLNMEEAAKLEQGKIGGFKDVFVSIELVHENVEYVLTRKERYHLTERGISKPSSDDFDIKVKNKNGGLEPIRKADYYRTVNKILPEKLSNYFFFWGEKIETLTVKRNISSAVKDFLGLSTLDNAKKHINTAIKEFHKLLSDVGVGDRRIEKIQSDIALLDKDIETAEYKRDEAEKNYDIFNKKYQVLQSELTNGDNRDIQEFMKELKKYNDQLTLKRQELVSEKEMIIKAFNRDACFYYAESLSKKASEMLERNKDLTTGWAHVTAKTIDEIIARGECLCGNKVEGNSDLIQRLQEIKKIVSPNVIGGQKKAFIDEIKMRTPYNKRYYDDVFMAYKRIRSLQADIIDLESHIEELQVMTMGRDELESKKMKLASYHDECIKSQRIIAQQKQRIDDMTKTRNALQQKLETVSASVSKNSKILEYIEYAKAVLSSIESEYSSKEKEVRANLQNYVQQYFKRMYTGERDVEIDNDFQVQAYNYVNGKKKSADTSPGLETVKNFAFIASLVQVAKDKIIDSDNDILSQEPYPLVLDAPFSQADEKHVPAISSLIADVAEQTIIVVMEKDWSYAKETMSNKVGAYYDLIKETETNTKVVKKEGV